MASHSPLRQNGDDWGRQTQLAALVSAIESGNCCVFVGAGLSIPAGYPGWQQLMQDLANAAGITFRIEDMDTSQAFLTFAGTCKSAMDQEDYYRFLRETFGRSGKEPYRPIHLDLVDIPFNAFLTTNFDCCLENAAERHGGIEGVQTYPVLEASYLRSRHIYHLHGRAHDEGGTSEVEFMVLTEGDYEDAYTGSGEIRSLLRDVLQHQSVLFIGLSLSDPVLDRILEETWGGFLAIRDYVQQHGLEQERDKTHFALLPRGGITSAGGEPSRDLESELTARLAQEESLLLERGISVIRYSDDDPFHTELTRIVRDIRDRTAERALPGHPTTYRSVFGREQEVS